MLNILREGIVETNDMKINRLLLSTDFDHAFDRVSHAYLWKVMEKLNFSPAVVNIFNGIYKEASSSLQINNCSNLEIEIKCGVRQGVLCQRFYLLYL